MTRFVALLAAVVALTASVVVATATPAHAYSCDAGATTPVLHVVFAQPETGYAGTLTNSGSAFCGENVTALKVTVERHTAKDGTPYAQAASSSKIEVNAYSATETASGLCPPTLAHHFGLAFHAIDYETNTVVVSPTRTSSQMSTRCNRMPLLEIG